MTNKEYRKWLKKHSETIEQTMSMRKWGEVVYSSVPGSAMRKYRRAFNKNDSRYDLMNGRMIKHQRHRYLLPIHTKCLLVMMIYWLKKLWNNLPDLLSESNENILPMIDVSGSMFGQPLAVATSLGMYLVMKAVIKGCFMSFNSRDFKGFTFRSSKCNNLVTNCYNFLLYSSKKY